MYVKKQTTTRLPQPTQALQRNYYSIV